MTPASFHTLHQLLDGIPAPAAALLANGIIARVNRPLAELLGPSPGSLHGAAFDSWVAAEERDRFRRLLTAAWQRRGMRADLLLRPDDGERLGVQLSLRRLMPPDPDVILLLAADLDSAPDTPTARWAGDAPRLEAAAFSRMTAETPSPADR